jgi:cbb3-type cytochrome oxidase subunit 1
VYVIAGIAIGIATGASQNFTLRPVHAHINLLGWTTMALAGLIYSVYPKAGKSRLAQVHFWIHNIALPVMMGSLTLLLLGHPGIIPVLGVSEFVAAGGVIALAANLFLNVKPGEAKAIV